MNAEPTVVDATLSAVTRLGDRGRPSLVGAARAMRTSPRTLQRHLHAAGVSFSEILERSAATKACRLLTRTSDDIRIVSERLGYRDPSSFSRAFRRWTGISPRQYRQRHATRSTRTGAQGPPAQPSAITPEPI